MANAGIDKKKCY